MRLISLAYLLSALAVVAVRGLPRTTRNSVRQDPSGPRIEFLRYQAKYGKHYDTTSEFDMRFDNWQRIDDAIQRQDKAEFVIGHNKFSDWSEDEKQGILNTKLSQKLPVDFERLRETEEFDLSEEFWGLPDDDLDMDWEFDYFSDDYGDEDDFWGADWTEEDFEAEFGSESGRPTKKRPPVRCPSGYRVLGTTCKKCPDGCKKCTSDISCRSCMSRNFIYDRMHRTCACYTGSYNATTNDCNDCGEGLFWDAEAEQCTSCNVDFCDTCKREGFCTRCVTNYTKRSGECSCRGIYYDDTDECINCRDDQYVTARTCADCPQNCSTCSSPFGLCTACLNPSFVLENQRCSCISDEYFVNNVTNVCTKYTYCGTGYYNDGQNNCEQCSDYCTSCNAVTGYCNICESDTMEFLNDTSLEANWHVEEQFQNIEVGACRCPVRTYWSAGQCIPLSVTCPDGKYNDGDNNCVDCPDNCTTCTDFLGWCMTCPDVSYNQTLLTDTGVCTCDEGQVIQMDDNGCHDYVDCGVGNYNDGHNVCNPCFTNCFSCLDGDGDCDVCQPTYSFDNITQQCDCDDVLEFELSGACITLIDCGDNFYNDGANNCVGCNSDNCDDCTIGTGVCFDCRDTFTYNADNDTCYCPYPETYWRGSDNTCQTIVECSSGQYNLGNNECQDCPANCTDCFTDIYDFTGTCTACSASFTMNSTDNCTCLYGEYMHSGGYCTDCADECAQCDDSTGWCRLCDYSGYTLSNGVCMCLNNYVVEDDMDCAALYQCSAGQYNDGANNCYTCDSSANCLTCSAATTCNTCKSTYSLSTQRTNQCDCVQGTQYESGGACHNLINCGAYYYNNGYNSCYRCKSNCTYCTSASVCTACISAYTLNYPSAGNCACNIYTYQYYYQNTCYGCRGGYGCGVCREPDGYCTQCKAHWTWYNWHCYCWAPSYASGSECYSCTWGCWSCNGNDCYSCRSTYTLHYPTSYRCGCTSGQYVNTARNCQTCPSYTYTCADTTAYAETCWDTFEIINNVCSCPDGQFIGTSVTTGQSACVSLTDCPMGQYNRGDNYCNNCPSNSHCLDCDLVSGSVKCVTCDATFTLSQGTGTYGSCHCLTDEYETSSGYCSSCGEFALTCADNTGYATSCEADGLYSIISGECVCQTTQVKLAGVCTDCPQDCATCSSLTQCTSCDSSFSIIGGICTCDFDTEYLNTGNNTCVFIYDPPEGYYNDGQNNFIACGPYCAECTSATAGDCTRCLTTFTNTAGECACAPYTTYQSGSTCVDVINCGNGYWNDGYNNCGTCTTNCTNCLGAANNCTKCDDTFTLHYPTFGQCACNELYYEDGSHECQAVAQNCSRSADSSGVCTNCVDTFTYDAVEDQCYCEEFTAWVESEDTCEDCSSGCAECSGSGSFCTGCLQTYIFNQAEGTCTCNSTSIDNAGAGCVLLDTCPDGEYNIGDQTCADCDPGCTLCDDITARCNECEDGYDLLAGYCNQWRRLEEVPMTCGNGCKECTNKKCLTCEQGMVLSKADQRECVFKRECRYPVGPVEQGQDADLCLQEPYSQDRVVPEFSDSDREVDWRQWNVIRPVQDQGKCGGDYAFSTTASAESRFAIKTGKLYDLSEQYLLDCDALSRGCQGGWQESASFLLSTSGAVLESDYPYVGKQQQCQEEHVDKVFKLEYPGARPVGANKEEFKAALRSGPLQVSFKVKDTMFYQYSAGIIPADYCGADDGVLNHSMLALGYGVSHDTGKEYAIVQNQWGADWGELGIFRVELSEDQQGSCGLYQQNLYSLV